MPDFLQMSGQEFLRYYSPVAIVSFLLALVLRAILPRLTAPPLPPQAHQNLTTDHLALLAHGPCALADSAIAALVNCGALKLAGGVFKKAGLLPRNGSAADQLIEKSLTPEGVQLKTLRKAVVDSELAQSLHNDLQQRALLHTDSSKARIRWIPAAVILVVLAVGIGKFLLGFSRGSASVLLLVVGMFQILALTAVLRKPPSRTHHGDALLKKLRSENAPLERPGNRELEALPPAAVHLASALFGQSVLIGALAPLASLMQSPTEAYGNPDAHYNDIEGDSSQ